MSVPSKREKTYQRILDAAAQSFKCEGFSGVGVNTIAQAADVTTGAFYAHFGSKDGAFEAVIKAGLQRSLHRIIGFQRDEGKKWPKAYADFYLSRQHRLDVADGCAITALSPDIARAAPEHQIAFDAGMVQIVDAVSAGLAKGTFEDRRDRAWSFVSTLTGGLILARAAHTPKLADDIATICRTNALAAVGKGLKIKKPEKALPDIEDEI